MDKEAKKQYMDTLRERYLKGTRKEKGRILDEYCRNTHQDRKYVIKKFRYKVRLKQSEERKKKKEYYQGEVRVALVNVWKIFDCICGQRLESILKDEVERLRSFGELNCSDEVALKLKKMSSATIDRKLEHERTFLANRRKYSLKQSAVLYQMVPVKTAAEMDRSKPGMIQIDCVEHCGSSAMGDYLNTLSTTCVFSGWWEGEAIMGKGQTGALVGLENTRSRYPFKLTDVHPDNGTNILNYHVLSWAEKHQIKCSRSRPYKKNDNCFVEQKNSTHVRQVVGYLRYDTEDELKIVNDLYRHELKLYKNFFQPTIKLIQKIRVKGKLKRQYDKPKTPYRRLMESPYLSDDQKKELNFIYQSLNPALLKRKIDQKLNELYRAYQKKMGSIVEKPLVNKINSKKITPSLSSVYHHSSKPISVS